MQFVVIEDQGVTPNLVNSSVTTTASSPEEAVSQVTGLLVDDLIATTWGTAPGVWSVTARRGAVVCALVVSR